MVQRRIDDEVLWASQQQDETARRNTMRRDHTEQSSETVRTGLSVGDKASIHGHRVTVSELLIVTPSGPTKAKVTYSSGKTDIVNYHSLHPLADPTSELMKPRDLSFDQGTFVFFNAPDDYVHGGIIMGSPSSDGSITVHDCLGNETQTRK